MIRKKNEEEQELQDHFHYLMTQLNDNRDSVKKSFKHMENEEILRIINVYEDKKDDLENQLEVAENEMIDRYEEEIRVKEKKQRFLSLHLLED